MCADAEGAPTLCSPLQPMEIFVDDEAKITLHGLVQHYIMLQVRQPGRVLGFTVQRGPVSDLYALLCSVLCPQPVVPRSVC